MGTSYHGFRRSKKLSFTTAMIFGIYKKIQAINLLPFNANHVGTPKMSLRRAAYPEQDTYL
jgi:hypothetical protein